MAAAEADLTTNGPHFKSIRHILRSLYYRIIECLMLCVLTTEDTESTEAEAPFCSYSPWRLCSLWSMQLGCLLNKLREGMAMKRILVLGGGFAGLWSAAGAARKLDEFGIGQRQVEVTLVNRDAYHSIRVRNYEADLAATRVPLREVLDPIGVRLVEGEVRAIDFARQTVSVLGGGGDDNAGV